MQFDLDLRCVFPRRWPNLVVQQVYYFLHLAIADLTAPLIIMCIAYSLIAKTLWNGLKTTHIVGMLILEETHMTSDEYCSL